ncbi:MAG: hypothetical protein LKK19_04555, partial [Bacteroidales bacterium]|nr:hypothetical protein [Bacteroidales bacterium]
EGTALGSYSPYSLFGIGNYCAQGTAYNRMMGGIGIGERNNRVINYLNPAAITARDTLSFMMDFGLNEENTLYKIPSSASTSVESTQDAFNVVNMNHIIATFPIYKKSAFIIGISPLSDVGYEIETRETSDDLLASAGDIIYEKNGSGSIYQAFAGAGVTLWDRLSLGMQGMFNFGTLNRFSYVYFNTNDYQRTVKLGTKAVLRGFSGKIGAQYEFPLGNSYSVVLGGTYRLASSIGGDVEHLVTAISGSTTDTLRDVTGDNGGILIPAEFGGGISISNGSKWSAGFDYTYQDWSKTTFDETPGIAFSPVPEHSFRFGFEYTPNRYDIRYYRKRITYRGGAYYNRTYYSFDGHRISSSGITFGVSLPVFRLYNAVQIAVDFGQRGALENGFFKDDTGLIREYYFNLHVSFSLHDIWFLKVLYD